MDPGELLQVVAAKLEELEVPYFVTGSMATIAYGEPRFTNDIDLVVRLEAGKVEALVGAFDAEDFYLARESVVNALHRRSSFNLIHPHSGLKVDFMVAEASTFNESRFERTRRLDIGTGTRLPFASPEDVILKKLQYYRDGGSEKHLRDIAGVLRTSREIDTRYIEEWSSRLGVEAQWTVALEDSRESLD